MKIIQDLKNHSSDSRLALMIRHADRESIPKGKFGDEILINEKGKHSALEFGEKIKNYRINKILTSPIQRCVQTAEFISKGYGKELGIITTKCLGNPGLHIADEAVAGEFYLKNGFDEMYRRFIANIPIPGIPDSVTFFKIMTTFLNENTNEKGITIFITHDSLIAFYHFCLDKTIYTKENWVNYLSGLIIKN